MADSPMIEIDPQIQTLIADSQMNIEIDDGDMILNMGPQHPATHGTLRLVVRLDGARQAIAARCATAPCGRETGPGGEGQGAGGCGRDC